MKLALLASASRAFSIVIDSHSRILKQRKDPIINKECDPICLYFNYKQSIETVIKNLEDSKALC